MDKFILFIFFIILLAYTIKIIRKKLYNYIINLDNEGTYNEGTTSHYNNYYKQYTSKNNRQLINNISFIRDGLISNIYDGDLKLLNIKKLNDEDTILILNNNDCNFEIFLAKEFENKNKKIKITIAKTNIIEVDKCEKMIQNLELQDNINVIYINELNKLENLKFNRIILKENIGRYDNRIELLTLLKKLLKNQESFLFIKTLVFNNLEENDKFMMKKQFDIINFWNYNFSTKQDIINDLKKLDYDVKYKSINVLLLSIFYNPQDIINLLKLYFCDLNLGISDIFNWLAVYTLNLLHIKAYKNF
tara:strand:+ start:1328 stop:2239 length:912 start_codon:yes stop_codon:yes gene_type:complete